MPFKRVRKSDLHTLFNIGRPITFLLILFEVPHSPPHPKRVYKSRRIYIVCSVKHAFQLANKYWIFKRCRSNGGSLILPYIRETS